MESKALVIIGRRGISCSGIRRASSQGSRWRRRPNETVVQAACRVGLALDNSILPIQGPPGAGKTFTGARMICELVSQRKEGGSHGGQSQGHSQTAG